MNKKIKIGMVFPFICCLILLGGCELLDSLLGLESEECSLQVVVKEYRFTSEPIGERLSDGETFNMGYCPQSGNNNITISVTNTGDAPVTFSGINISGDPTSDMCIWPYPDPALPVILAPGDATTFGVDFAPDIEADYTAQITLETYETGCEDFTFGVIATSIPPDAWEAGA